MRRARDAAITTVIILAGMAFIGLPFWAWIVVDRVTSWDISSWFYHHPWWAAAAMVGAFGWMTFWIVLFTDERT